MIVNAYWHFYQLLISYLRFKFDKNVLFFLE